MFSLLFLNRHQQLSRMLMQFSRRPKDVIPKDSYGTCAFLVHLFCMVLLCNDIHSLLKDLFCSDVLLDAVVAVSQWGSGSHYSCSSGGLRRHLLCTDVSLHGKSHSFTVPQTEQLSEVRLCCYINDNVNNDDTK